MERGREKRMKEGRERGKKQTMKGRGRKRGREGGRRKEGTEGGTIEGRERESFCEVVNNNNRCSLWRVGRRKIILKICCLEPKI